MPELTLAYLRTIYNISLIRRYKNEEKTDWIYHVQLRDRRTKGIVGTRSTGFRQKTKAAEQLLPLAIEIHERENDEPEQLTWSEFTQRYENEVLATQRESTQANMRSIIRKIEGIVHPKSPKSLKASNISKFTAELRKQGLTTYSIKRNLSGLRTLLNWACKMEYIDRVPHIRFPDSRDLVRTKGRPLTEEEFAAICAQIPNVVGEERLPEWRRLLKGLWLSGLRLDELLNLHWSKGNVVVDFSSIHPRFKIQPAGEKAKRYRRHPMTPDFFLFLLETPETERRGFVFWPSAQIRSRRYTKGTAGKKIAKMGELAGIEAGRGRLGTTHFGSSHDFRRSFGERWRQIVRPEELQRLMRHQDIKTTEMFYTSGVDDDLAEDVWAHADPEQMQAMLDLANNRANNREVNGDGGNPRSA